MYHCNSQGLDIGPDSIKTFEDALKTCKTVVWNGPMGVFEFDKFAKGTYVSGLYSGVVCGDPPLLCLCLDACGSMSVLELKKSLTSSPPLAAHTSSAAAAADVEDDDVDAVFWHMLLGSVCWGVTAVCPVSGDMLALLRMQLLWLWHVTSCRQ
jgi:hypothetical protein